MRRGNEAACTAGFTLTLVMSLLSYPLVLKFFFPTAYQLALLGAMVCLICVLAVANARVQIRWGDLSNTTKIILISYATYVLLITVASFANGTQPYIFEPTLRLYVKLLFAVLLMTMLPLEQFSRVFAPVVIALTFFAAAALILWVAVLLDLTTPVTTLTFQAAHGPTERSVYWLGMTWGQIRDPISGWTITRLQSFSDEPGNFAFACLAAYLCAIGLRRHWAVIMILLLAVAFTLSVGAAAFAIGAFLFLTARHRGLPAMVVAGTVGSGLIIGILVLEDTPLYQFADYYLATKLTELDSESVTSLGVRLDHLAAVVDVAATRPLGLGLGARGAVFHQSLGADFFLPMLEGGFPTFAAYIAFSVAVLYLATRAAFSTGSTAYLGLAVLALLFASLQRLRIDDSFFGLFILVWLIRSYEMERLRRRVRGDSRSTTHTEYAGIGG